MLHFRLTCLLLLLGLVGCSSGPAVSRAKPAAVDQAVWPAEDRPTTEPADAPLVVDPATLVKQTTQYVQTVGPLVANAKMGAAAPATKPAAAVRQPRDSVVEWADPSRAAEGETADAGGAAVANRPLTDSATLATAHLKQEFDVPEIVPEADDQLVPSPAAQPKAVPVAVAAATPSVASPSSPVPADDDFEKQLRQRAHDYPRDLSDQLDYQMYRLLRGQPAPDMAGLDGLSSEDRDILAAVLDGLSNFRNVAAAGGDPMLNQKIQPMLEMAERLRQQAGLTIPTMALCTRVDGFGIYKPMLSTQLQAGVDNDMVVYCEVDNFDAVRNAQQQWETRLSHELVLYDDAGQPVWRNQPNAQSVVDVTPNRRHDFFIARKIRLPATLPAGHYLLKLTLTDEQSHRVAEATTPVDLTIH